MCSLGDEALACGAPEMTGAGLSVGWMVPVGNGDWGRGAAGGNLRPTSKVGGNENSLREGRACVALPLSHDSCSVSKHSVRRDVVRNGVPMPFQVFQVVRWIRGAVRLFLQARSDCEQKRVSPRMAME